MNSRVLSNGGRDGVRRGVIQASLAVGVAAAAAGLLAACGGSTSPTTSAAAASTPTATASFSRNAAYLACLRQHGADIPTAFPSRTRPTDRPSGVRPSGGFGGFGGGFFGQSQSPQMQAAVQACAAIRPAGGFGGFGGRGGTQLVAFRNCMTQQGVTIPTTRPTAFPSPTSSTDRTTRYLGGLNPSDPKVAAALKICSPLLPTGRPSSAPTG